MTNSMGAVSRRSVLRGAGVVTLGVAGAALLGCGGGGGGGGAPTGGEGGTGLRTIEGATRGGGLPLVAPKVEGKPKYGGMWRTTATSLPQQFDPHTALGGNVWHFIGEKVLEIHPVEGKVLPHMATSWEVADPKGLTLVFKIQPGIKIHNKPPWNGREFTAEDVAWNMERIGGLYAQREGIPLASFQRASMVAHLQKAEAVDKTTVKVTLSKPNSGFFNGLTENRVPMMPVEMVDIGFKDPLKMGGVGAWEVTEWKTDSRRHFVKHPQYFRKGEPYFDTVETIIVPDAAATQAAFISGETQAHSVAQPEDVAVMKRAKPDANLYTTVDSNWQHFRLQVQDFVPFRDFRVRKGIFLATDVTEMANGYYGDGWGYQSVLSPGFPEAWKPDKVKQIPGINPDTKPQDIAEGKKMLEAAGYPNGKGIDIEFRPSSATGISFENAVRFQGQMRNVFPEMKITLKPFAPGELAVPQAEGRFQMIAYTITAVPDAVLELHSQYHTNGSRNYGRFSDPGYDALVDKMLVELDMKKRAEMLDEAQRRWYDEWMAQYVLYAQARKQFVQGDIGGFDETWGIWIGYGLMTKIHRWYYVQK